LTQKHHDGRLVIMIEMRVHRPGNLFGGRKGKSSEISFLRQGMSRFAMGNGGDFPGAGFSRVRTLIDPPQI